MCCSSVSAILHSGKRDLGCVRIRAKFGIGKQSDRCCSVIFGEEFRRNIAGFFLLHFFLFGFAECKIPEHIFNGHKHVQGVAQSDHVPGIGRAVGNACHQTLQVIDRSQIFADLIAVYTLFAKSLHAVKPLLDLCPLCEGLFQKAVKEAGTHGSTGLVKNPEQGAAFFLVAKGLCQFQIPACGTVQKHIFSRRIGTDPGEV